MMDPARELPQELREKTRKSAMPESISPMLATLTHEHFSDPGWIYERKFDGERCLCFCTDGQVRLLTRNNKDLNAVYPELVDALEGTGNDFLADGEVAAFKGDVTDFSTLQQRMQIQDEQEARSSDIPVYYYLFDVLHLNGFDLTKVPLRERKRLLKQLLEYKDPVRYTTHRNEEGEAFYKEACKAGWEGVIAKDAEGEYVRSRSKKWLKFKCVHQQEFVLGGYTEPEGSRIGFGALLIGYYDGDELVYAGKIGTGFDDETLHRLSERFASLERKTSPFDRGNPDEMGVHWLSPQLVAEAGFTEWTKEGKLRHPRFLGLRRDKEPQDVVRESA